MRKELWALLMSMFILIVIYRSINKKKNTQLSIAWLVSILQLEIWCIALICQILFSERFNIDPVYFDYIVYSVVFYLPISILAISEIYVNTNIKLKKRYMYLFIFPTISLIILWTNNLHHLFYESYSIYMNETVVGNWFYFYTIYQYILIAFGVFKLLQFSVKNSGFFSKQSMLIVLGIMVPVVTNILGTFNLIPMTIYITPICFTFTFIFLAIAMFKYNFFEASPIALQKIVDLISDSYIVVNEFNTIIDFNQTLLNSFHFKDQNLRGKDLSEFLIMLDKKSLVKEIEKNINSSKFSNTKIITEEFVNINRIYNIEITSIYSKDKFIGTIILFKDITEHTNDLKQIEDNQYVMQRQAQFAILGEFAGGLAHDLNSPLSAVQLDIGTLQKYMKSDRISAEPEVRAVLNEMLENIDSSLNKMTRIIAGVRNQIRATGNTEKEVFNLKEIVDGIEILFGSILRKNNCIIDNLVDEQIEIYGEKNKLDRVIGNVIKNSIDAYMDIEGKGIITVHAKIIDDKCVIAIQDEAGGIPEDVAKTMFKEMKTTKSETGTGFGLYYSNTIIESSFKGKMSFETEAGKGTVFYITLPMIKEVV